MLYQASNVSSTKDRVSSLMAESDRSVRWHRRLFKLMEKDPESLTAGMDPLLTVRDGVCYLEAFDKTVNRCVTLRLNPSLWLDGGKFQDGSARIEFVSRIHSAIDVVECQRPSPWLKLVLKLVITIMIINGLVS